jgi:hypothetical protein
MVGITYWKWPIEENGSSKRFFLETNLFEINERERRLPFQILSVLKEATIRKV